MVNQRRTFLRLGATLLLVGFAMGIAAAVPLPNPGRWMVAHVTAIMLGTLIIAQALAWNDLRLSGGQRTWFLRLTQLQVWGGVALGIGQATLDIPGPASTPGVSPDAIQGAVLAIGLAIIVPATVGAWILFWMGLRGQE